jgi:hypothetical protein
VEKHFNGCNLKGAFTNGLKCENFNNGYLNSFTTDKIWKFFITDVIERGFTNGLKDCKCGNLCNGCI